MLGLSMIQSGMLLGARLAVRKRDRTERCENLQFGFLQRPKAARMQVSTPLICLSQLESKACAAGMTDGFFLGSGRDAEPSLALDLDLRRRLFAEAGGGSGASSVVRKRCTWAARGRG